jgi:hypothetical protein
LRRRIPCEIEWEVRKAEVRWSVSPASPACGRSQKVSKIGEKISERTEGQGEVVDELKPRSWRQLLREVMLAKRK